MFINRFLIIVGLISLLITGCGNETGKQSGTKNSVNITNISNQNVYDQEPSNKAKKLVAAKKNVTAIDAVNTDKKMIIAIEVPHHERFQLKDIRDKLTKELKKQFKQEEITVELSTDQKIIWELEKLEEKLQKNNISNKELKKEIKRISKLMKEQT
jgi:preprotein translocase subunit SecF